MLRRIGKTISRLCQTITGVRAVRNSDEIEDEIDSVINRTQAQLGVLEERAHQLANVISEGKHGHQHRP